MNPLYDYLTVHPVVYVTRDIERALALPLPARGYYIITNRTSYSMQFEKQFPKNILLVQNKGNLLDTHELLGQSDTKKYLDRLQSASLVVFKNTPHIEKIAKENKWNLLNPSSPLSNRIEEKIEQIHWLREYASYLPPHTISKLKDILFKNYPFIVQFNHAHSGEGTILIENEKDLRTIGKLFPNREVRKMEYVDGWIYTSNNIVTSGKILMGNLSYQITGSRPFTDLRFATIGNDFSLPTRSLSPSELIQYKKIVSDIGKKLESYGWKGLFGIDVIVSKKTGRVYLIEINARQCASSTFESELQNDMRKKKQISGLTVFEAHLMSLLGMPIGNELLIPLSNGAQIIQRITQKRKKMNTERIQKLRELGLSVLPYDNTTANSELLRLQSRKGMMEEPGVFNELGKKIAEILS